MSHKELDKETVKKVLELGGTVQFPHKSKLNEWYETISISPRYGKGIVVNAAGYVQTFEDVDVACDMFLAQALSPHNVGRLQALVTREMKYPDNEDIQKIKKAIEEYVAHESEKTCT